jgi:hypothetical protein
MNLNIVRSKINGAAIAAGFVDEEKNTTVIKYFTECSDVVNPYILNINAIKNNKSLSTSGQLEQIEAVKQKAVERLATFQKANDKSTTIEDRLLAAQRVVAAKRLVGREVDPVIRYLQQQELRQHFDKLRQAHAEKLRTLQGLVSDQDRTYDPVREMLLAACADYSVTKEALVGACLNAPWPLSPIDDDTRGEANRILQQGMAGQHLSDALLAGKHQSILEATIKGFSSLIDHEAVPGQAAV